jgi:hypothetical protein
LVKEHLIRDDLLQYGSSARLYSCIKKLGKEQAGELINSLLKTILKNLETSLKQMASISSKVEEYIADSSWETIMEKARDYVDEENSGEYRSRLLRQDISFMKMYNEIVNLNLKDVVNKEVDLILN